MRLEQGQRVIKSGSILNSIHPVARVKFLARYVVLHVACTFVDAFRLQFFASDEVGYSIIPRRSVHVCF